MSGKAPRQKGNRFERGIVAALRDAGLDAFRVPLSGSMRGFKQDVIIRRPGSQLTIEAKSRGRGFTFIYKSIEGADLLAIKADRSEPLIVLRLADYAALLSQLDGAVSQQPASSIPKATKQVTQSNPLTNSINPQSIIDVEASA